jgi:hypothetical protein
MYSATKKQKLEGAATFAATLLLAAAPPAALAAIVRRDSRRRDHAARARLATLTPRRRPDARVGAGRR